VSKLRVLVIDDSAFSRRTIIKILEDIKTVEVVGYATNGEEGISKVSSLKPDLVTLDLDMPRMDGFTLLRILTARCSVPVIVISALSGADKVFKALDLGALDFVAKPCSNASKELLLIREDIRRKVLHLSSFRAGNLKQQLPVKPPIARTEPTVPPSSCSGAEQRTELVAIGASTGGPPALQQLLTAFDRPYPFAVLVSQHMPAGFTRAFADRLNNISPFEIKEAADGDPVLPGRVLIAAGGTNLLVEDLSGTVRARVVPPSADDRYVPSVDAMLTSCAALYRTKMTAVILTGMGNDGSMGIREVKRQGGHVIAESEETAIVYGMPREAAATGVVDRIVPLQRIAREILIKGAFV
jgi:two-component system chemotaxis response regulator CheB